jgi:hypothetical protein
VLKSVLKLTVSLFISPRDVLSSVEEDHPYLSSFIYAWTLHGLASLIALGGRSVQDRQWFDTWDVIWALAVGLFAGSLWVVLGGLALSLAALTVRGKAHYQAACAAASFLALSAPISAGLKFIPKVGPLLSYLPGLWVVIVGTLALTDVLEAARSRAWILCALVLSGTVAYTSFTQGSSLLSSLRGKTPSATTKAPKLVVRSPTPVPSRVTELHATAPAPVAQTPDASAPDPEWEVTVNSIPPNAEIFRADTPTALGFTPTTLRFQRELDSVPLRLRLAGKEVSRTVTPGESVVVVTFPSDETTKPSGPGKKAIPSKRSPSRKSAAKKSHPE